MEACIESTFDPRHLRLTTSYAQLMQLSDEQIGEFIEAWKADFGETLSIEEARAEALRLLDFFGQFAEGLARIRQRALVAVATDHL